MSPDPVLLEARDVVRTYTMVARGERRWGRFRRRSGDSPPAPAVQVHALRGVTFSVDRGDYVAIVGTSGSGKSTLLNLLGALDRPTSGTVRYDGRDVAEMDDAELAELRNGAIGFVFQSFHLLPRLTALDNVQLPLVYRRTTPRERRDRAQAALAAVGLADRVAHRPPELSGGQQQRVAIARALVTEPPLLLADEPTGNLDTATGEDIMGLLEGLHRDRDVAVVVITHEREIARRAQRRIELRDGAVVGQGSTTDPDPGRSWRISSTDARKAPQPGHGRAPEDGT